MNDTACVREGCVVNKKAFGWDIDIAKKEYCWGDKSGGENEEKWGDEENNNNDKIYDNIENSEVHNRENNNFNPLPSRYGDGHIHFLSVHDPFEVGRDLGDVCCRILDVKQEFVRAYLILKEGKGLYELLKKK
jgi:hypothetical protein